MQGQTLVQKSGWRKLSKNTKILSLVAILLFFNLYVFYTKLHPMYVLDMDDWIYITHTRSGLPQFWWWNPSRVLPEIWMPLAALFGSRVVYPFTGDIMEAWAIGFALTAAVVITSYVLFLRKLLVKRYQIGTGESVCIMLLFLGVHFALYLTRVQHNTYLFFAGNVTCFFYYTLPALWNFILCCYYQERDHVQKSPLIQGCICIAVYLAIFSNMFQSIILMSLFGIQLLFALIEGIWRRKGEKHLITWQFLKEYLAEHYQKIFWILVWFVSMHFEINGGRSYSIGDKWNLKESVNDFILSIQSLKLSIVIVMLTINVIAILIAVVRFKHHKEEKFLYWQLQSMSCMLLTIAFLILLSAKVAYINSPRVLISWMMWGLLMTASSLAYLTKVVPKTSILLPFLLYVMIFETSFSPSRYADYGNIPLSPAGIKALCDNEIIAPMVVADQEGLKTVEVYLPESQMSGWPFGAESMKSRIPDALFYHGVVRERIDVTVIASPEKDVQYHLK